MEKGIKITIKNGLYEVTLANVNGKEMMLSIGTLLQSVYSHAKQNGVEDKFEKDIRHIVDNVFENSFAKDTTNGKDSKSYEASLKSRTDELKKLIDFAREIGVKNDELLSAAEKATEIVSGYFDENMRGENHYERL